MNPHAKNNSLENKRTKKVPLGVSFPSQVQDELNWLNLPAEVPSAPTRRGSCGNTPGFYITFTFVSSLKIVHS